MKRDHIRLILLYLVVTVFLIACGVSGLFNDGAGNNQAELEGITWNLKAMGPQGNLKPAADDKLVTMIFDFSEGRVHGNGGCNSYSADFDINGSKITIGLAMSTLMACFPEELMEQETSFHQMLAKAERYEVENSKLSIFTSDGQMLIFSSSP